MFMILLILNNLYDNKDERVRKGKSKECKRKKLK